MADDIDQGAQGTGNDPAYIHVGDIWRLLGLSENGFRFYEKKGIVNPTRNEANGYRVLTLSDGMRLCNAYDLTRYGFSIDQTNEILSASIEEGTDALQRHSDGMGRELQAMLARKEHLDGLIRTLRQYMADPLQCTLTKNASLVFLPVHNQDMSLNRDPYGDGTTWWKTAPLVDAGLLVTLGYDNGGIEAIHGPATSMRTAAQWGLPLENALEFCRTDEEYLHFFTKFPAGGMPDPGVYLHARVFLANHGLKMKGEQVLHRLLRHVVEGGTPLRVDEVFMPVENVGM